VRLLAVTLFPFSLFRKGTRASVFLSPVVSSLLVPKLSALYIAYRSPVREEKSNGARREQLYQGSCGESCVEDDRLLWLPSVSIPVSLCCPDWAEREPGVSNSRAGGPRGWGREGPVWRRTGQVGFAQTLRPRLPFDFSRTLVVYSAPRSPWPHPSCFHVLFYSSRSRVETWSVWRKRQKDRRIDGWIAWITGRDIKKWSQTDWIKIKSRPIHLDR